MSSLGRRFTLREACVFLDITTHEMYALIRARRVTYHQHASAAAHQRKKADGTTTRYQRGSNYFFYERELEADQARTRVAARPFPAALSHGQVLLPHADISDLLPTHRRFS